MPVAPSRQQFESTCPGNTSTNVWITLQPGVGQPRDRVRWNRPVEGNRMVYVSRCAQGYRCQQGEKGGYLSGQMSSRVGKGLIAARSPRGIERYMSRSVRMPVAHSSQQFDDTYPGNSSTKEWITQSSDSIGTGCVGMHRSRGIEWCRFRSVRMAIQVSRM